jgi:hypothetical protein
MEISTLLSDAQSPATHAQNEAMQDILYQQGIGSLMYAVISTPPDTSFTITTLSQFMRNLGYAHLEATKHVLHYLKGMSKSRLTLGSSEARLEACINTD